MTEPTNEPTPAPEPQPIPADVRRFVEMVRDWFDDDYPICEFADKWTQVSGKWEPDMFHSEATRILALLDQQPASVDPFREELACLRVETLEKERDEAQERAKDVTEAYQILKTASTDLQQRVKKLIGERDKYRGLLARIPQWADYQNDDLYFTGIRMWRAEVARALAPTTAGQAGGGE